MVSQLSPAWKQSRENISNPLFSPNKGTPHSRSWYPVNRVCPLAQPQRTIPSLPFIVQQELLFRWKLPLTYCHSCLWFHSRDQFQRQRWHPDGGLLLPF